MTPALQNSLNEGEVIETTAVVRQSIVLPAASPQEALEAWHKYEELKRAILRDEDFLQIGEKKFPKKSAWRKISTFFNLTVELVSEREIKNSENGSIDFDVVYRAIAPNGRSSVGDGACNNMEKKDRHGNSIENSRHNTRGTAHTRAYNRAVSNLVGGGEVSAEEVEQEDFHANPTPQTSPKGGLRNPEKKAGSVAGGKRVKKGGDPIYPTKLSQFIAISREHGWSDLGLKNLLAEWGYADAKEIGWKDYDAIVRALETEQEKTTTPVPKFGPPHEDAPPIGDEDIR